MTSTGPILLESTPEEMLITTPSGKEIDNRAVIYVHPKNMAYMTDSSGNSIAIEEFASLQEADEFARKHYEKLLAGIRRV